MTTLSVKNNGTEYEKYTTRVADREQTISDRIANKSDPLQAIDVITETQGASLQAIWESDSGYPIDGTLFLIVMIPVALGLIGHYTALYWEPKTTGEELYDDFGNRIVEYPKLPIAYLQQTRKDLSASRENRNSLAWLCHKWLISTNEVVQELQAPYPLETQTLRTIPELRGQGKRIARMYENLQKAAREWQLQKKKMKREDLRKQSELRKRAKPLHTLPYRFVFRKAPAQDVDYLRRRAFKAKKLWSKLNKWIKEWEEREELDRLKGVKSTHPSDGNDSYWSSSETFSSDSGEHWKSYKSAAQKWTRGLITTAQWKLHKGRKLQEIANAAAILAEEERKEMAAIAAATEARSQKTDSSKSKSYSSKFSFAASSGHAPRKKSATGENLPPIKVDKVSYKSEGGSSGKTKNTTSSEKLKRRLSEVSKIKEPKPPAKR